MTPTVVDLMHALVKRIPVRDALMLRSFDDNESRWQRAIAAGVASMRNSR